MARRRAGAADGGPDSHIRQDAEKPATRSGHRAAERPGHDGGVLSAFTYVGMSAIAARARGHVPSLSVPGGTGDIPVSLRHRGNAGSFRSLREGADRSHIASRID